MKKYLRFLLVLTLVFSLAGVVSAQSFRIGIGESPTTKNYWAALGPDASMFNFTVQSGYYGVLYGLAYPTYMVVPGLAAEGIPEVKEDGDYYTAKISLKKGLKWSNGESFTADDVVFTISTVEDLELEGNWESYRPEPFVKIEKVDDYTVEFYFSEKPGLAEWTYGILNCTILPESQWGEVVEEAKKKDDPMQYLYSYQIEDIVTIDGMEFGQWEQGSYWQNVKVGNNPKEVTKIYENGRHEITSGDWSWAGFGDEGSDLKYTVESGPFIDEAVYNLYSNQDSMIMALKKGDIDYLLSAQGLTRGFRNELEKSSEVEVVSNPSNGWRFLSFNRDRYPFEFQEFHQAMATMIDRDYLMNSVLQGAGKPLATFVPPGNEYWHNPNIEAWGAGLSQAERVEKAVGLLEEAGFTWEKKPTVDLENNTYTRGRGIIMPNGEKMEPFDILTPPSGYDPLRATCGLWIQNWSQDLGIPARAKPTQFNVIQDKVFSQQDYDAFILGWGLGGTFPDFMNVFFKSDAGYNINGYKDEKFDKIVSDLMKVSNMEKAQELAYKAQERLHQTLPYIILFSTPIYDAYRSDRVEFPATEVLDGIQGFYGLPTSVKIIE